MLHASLQNAVMSPIRYYEFCDVPRAFIAADTAGTYLLDCPFDDQLDDYPEFYEVFAMPALGDELLSGSWADLSRHALGRLGRVRVSDVRFDASRRREVDLDGIRQILNQ